MTAPHETTTNHKILLLDDDPDVLSLYQQILLEMPSRPEVHISSSGAGAMTMLESEPFNVLICDLNMPKMDGLQVIAIVRRKFPQLRTVVLTGVADEQMRARAYAMGIDLYLEKPKSEKEWGFLTTCVATLLHKQQTGGFRGVQSKSMVDLIQLECLTGSSCVLKISNGKMEGRIWIHNGEPIDAASPDLEGEDAFKSILSWKTGSFEILPHDPDRPRKVHTSCQGLLLDSAQALDEAVSDANSGSASEEVSAETGKEPDAQVRGLGRIQGVEFAIKFAQDTAVPVQKWGLENTESLTNWSRETVNALQHLAEKFQLGALEEMNGVGVQRQLCVVAHADKMIAIGLLPTLTREQSEQSAKKVLEQWAF